MKKVKVVKKKKNVILNKLEKYKKLKKNYGYYEVYKKVNVKYGGEKGSEVIIVENEKKKKKINE